MNTEDSSETVLEFTEEAGLQTPSLTDAMELYRRYQGLGTDGGGRPWAPYPLQVVVDQDGVIQYINQQYDATRLRNTVDGLLDSGG